MDLGVQVNKVIVNCDNCGKEFKITENQYNRTLHHFCNKECFNKYTKRNQVKCICPICGSEFYRKKSQIDNMKDSSNATCSKECSYKLRKTLYKNEGNPQYGLTGNKNASWESDERYTNNNNRYTLIRVEDHPFRDKNNFVPEHRLVAEQYLLTDENSIEVNGKKYLKPECVVHHIDFNKKNNKVENLYVFENEGVHVLFHNLIKSDRIKNLDEFFKYYEDNYINKILNYDWLYKAYISYNLSVNQISNLFNIPYKSIQTEIYKHNLNEVKRQNNHKEELLRLISEELQKLSENLGSSSK